MTTNGRKLKNQDLLDQLVESGVSRITLSIHSHKEEIENHICNRKNAFTEKIQAIRNIVESVRARRFALPDGFALNSCIHGLNLRNLTGLASFFRKLGVRDLRLNYVMPERRAVGDPRLIPPVSRVGPSLERLAFWNESQGKMRITISDLPFCAFPEPFHRNPHLFKKYLGDERDLDTFVVMHGGPRQDADLFRWKERRQDRLKTRPNRCDDCAAGPACEGIWKKYIALYGDEELTPIPRNSPKKTVIPVK